MTVTIIIDYQQLCVINSLMKELDTVVFEGLAKKNKSVVAICIELREKLLQKAIKTRLKTKEFNLKLKYYMAEALLNYLLEFDILFDVLPGMYEYNVLIMVKNQLHQKLQ